MSAGEHEHTERGLRGEKYVARRDDLEPAEVDWCDLRNPRTGSAHEVKVAEPGRRFRLWEDQHRSLAAAHGQNAAWYQFLVVVDSGNVLKERRAHVPTVTRIVSERGGWNQSGHKRESRQHKLPVSEIF
jgi:hypothetical protein